MPTEDVDPIAAKLYKAMNKVRNKAKHDITLGATMDQAMQELGYVCVRLHGTPTYQ